MVGYWMVILSVDSKFSPAIHAQGLYFASWGCNNSTGTMDRRIASLNNRRTVPEFSIPALVECCPLLAAENSIYGSCELADDITDTASRLAVELAGMGCFYMVAVRPNIVVVLSF